MDNLSETQNQSSSTDKKGISRVWQIVVGASLMVLAGVISVFEIISQARKYKKASIPIEIYQK